MLCKVRCFYIAAFSLQGQSSVSSILLQFSSSGIIYQHGCCVVSGNLVLEGQSDKQCSSCYAVRQLMQSVFIEMFLN